jgi:hypothetical protein
MVAVLMQRKEKGRKALRNQSKASQTSGQDGSGHVCMARREIRKIVSQSKQGPESRHSLEWRRIQRAPPALCIRCRTDPTNPRLCSNACKRQLLPLIFPVHMLPRIAMTCSMRFTFSYKSACMPASYFFLLLLINRDFDNSTPTLF